MNAHPSPLRRYILAFGCIVALALGGCGRGGHDHAHDDDAHDHGHSHDPRHGGVAVALGDEAYHVEFTHGEAPGTIRAYFFDGHMENYVRISAPSLAATATIGGVAKPLVFTPVVDAATGETVGDTALFEARADWLDGRPAVVVQVPQVEVRGTTYTQITASLPAGSHP